MYAEPSKDRQNGPSRTEFVPLFAHVLLCKQSIILVPLRLRFKPNKCVLTILTLDSTVHHTSLPIV